MSEQIEFLPPADPNVTCSRELRDRVLADFEHYHATRARKRIGRRVSVIATIGLILMALTYAKFHRLSPKLNPIEMVDKERNIQHGIPPKPPYIIPAPLQVPAWQRHLPPLYPRYPQKLPKKVGGGNYQLL
jgi:hypothetical protein